MCSGNLTMTSQPLVPNPGAQLARVIRLSSTQTAHFWSSQLHNHIRRGDWLSVTNRYRQDCLNRLKDDTKQNKSPDPADLGQYIAASAPLHCCDGWALLGRAIDCLSRGDNASAVHLAYYAELRAAFSLLACGGVGIFDHHHFLVDTNGHCQGFDGNTHAIIWEALTTWAESPEAEKQVCTSVCPDGIPLEQWLSNFGMAPTATHVAGTLLAKWGVDLVVLSDDRHMRNEVSYRPTRLNPKATPDPLFIAEFLHSLWTLCEPEGRSRFPHLDRELLRLSLDITFKGIGVRPGKSAQADFEERIDDMLKGMAVDASAARNWKGLLRWSQTTPLPLLIKEANKPSTRGGPIQPTSIIARATLLLRVATGLCQDLLRNAGFGRASLRFWWNPLGEDFGLWSPGNEPDPLMDLYSDIEDALRDAGHWAGANAGVPPSMEAWRREQSSTISTLGSCERIALWGLGL